MFRLRKLHDGFHGSRRFDSQNNLRGCGREYHQRQDQDCESGSDHNHNRNRDSAHNHAHASTQESCQESDRESAHASAQESARNRAQEGDHDFAHAHGFNFNAIIILNIIEQESGKREHPDLSTIIQEQLHITKPAVSMQLKTLERKGLIERAVNPDDLRRFDFKLTQRGQQIARHLRCGVDNRLQHLIEKMGVKDLRELLRLLNKMMDIMQDGGKEAGNA
jgi:DNA-binding MarR family transcriptional regulator